jgi:ketosteroid isomerase-like protein
MATANPNVELLSHAYARWSESRGRSVDDWVAIASPGFHIRSVSDGHAEAQFGDVPAGHDGLRTYLTELLAHWIMERHDVERFVADGDHVVALIRAIWRNRETNKQIDCELVDVWSFEAGQATSLLEVFDTAAMIEAATPDAA